MNEQPKFAHQWLKQWNHAAGELERVHDAELRALSAEDALRATTALLDLADGVSILSTRWTYSGLVEQQRFFMRSRAR